jgi:hypothetical protein
MITRIFGNIGNMETRMNIQGVWITGNIRETGATMKTGEGRG